MVYIDDIFTCPHKCLTPLKNQEIHEKISNKKEKKCYYVE